MKSYKSETLIRQGDSIGIFRSRPIENEPIHTHDFIEIVYVLSGSATQRINGEYYDVKRGDVLFINYGSSHAFEPRESFEFYNVIFSPETVGHAVITRENALALLSLTAFDEMRRDADGGLISFTGEDRREVENLLSAMLREQEASLPSCAQVIENYRGILITKMLRKTQFSENNRAEWDSWKEITEYIDNNLGAELTLSALAKKCFYNPSYFSRAFKQKFNVSLTEYVNRRRIDRATELLRDPSLSVDEISARVGFSDRSSFYHVFSRITGGTPSDYRKK